MNDKLMHKNGLKESQFEPQKDETKETLERVEAQTLYTALMTDTMLDEEETDDE